MWCIGVLHFRKVHKHGICVLEHDSIVYTKHHMTVFMLQVTMTTRVNALYMPDNQSVKPDPLLPSRNVREGLADFTACLICNLKTAPVLVLHTEVKVLSQNGTVRSDWSATMHTNNIC